MSAETWASIGVTGATALAGVFAGRAARRTRRQESRDDFATVTDRMDKELLRQGGEIKALRERADVAEKRVEGAVVAVGYLLDRVRGLTILIRSVGMEPPAAPPIPTKAREFIHGIDV
ncbi:hypothetical protein ACIPW5_11535 [Streptomyces sp. NPDC090077]|uniref:hypothetical protein n=1 Tax=Streptomyces sp. NPDC090077 TaxID=3365938 RepID=UPI003812CBA8